MRVVGITVERLEPDAATDEGFAVALDDDEWIIGIHVPEIGGLDVYVVKDPGGKL